MAKVTPAKLDEVLALKVEELDALRKDAERYRALRNPNCLSWPIAMYDMRHPSNKRLQPPLECIGAEFDAVVDAAMDARRLSGAA